jgi:hypothetical protein
MAAAHHPALALTHQPLPAFCPSDASLINDYPPPQEHRAAATPPWRLRHDQRSRRLLEAPPASWPSSTRRRLTPAKAGCPASGTPSPAYVTQATEVLTSRAVGGATAGMVERWYSDRKGRTVDGTCSHPKLVGIIRPVRPVGPTGQTGMVKVHGILFGLQHWIGLDE